MGEHLAWSLLGREDLVVVHQNFLMLKMINSSLRDIFIYHDTIILASKSSD